MGKKRERESLNVDLPFLDFSMKIHRSFRMKSMFVVYHVEMNLDSFSCDCDRFISNFPVSSLQLLRASVFTQRRQTSLYDSPRGISNRRKRS